jgi:hypothetical protein
MTPVDNGTTAVAVKLEDWRIPPAVADSRFVAVEYISKYTVIRHGNFRADGCDFPLNSLEYNQYILLSRGCSTYPE